VSKEPRGRAAKVHVLQAADLATPPLVLGSPTLTISGLAAALAPLAPDTAATVQMLRHWTREGMLLPVAHSHGGPGKHREYDSSTAVYDAAILFIFNDLGLPISGSRPLVEALDQVRSEVAKRRTGKGKKTPHLVISRTAAGATAVAVYGEGEKVVDRRGFKAAEVVATIDIDLEKLFGQVGGKST
jgi:DNA-binding transcriptional MerR regulator